MLYVWDIDTIYSTWNDIQKAHKVSALDWI